MRQAPKVVDGARGPEQNPVVGASPADSESGIGQRLRAIESKAVKPADGEVVFQSRYGAYRIQVTAPADTFNPVTGQYKRARPVFAQFRFGEFKTKDPEIIETLKGSKDYGLDFWDAAEQFAKDKEATLAALVAEVTRHPELRDRVLQELASAELPVSQPSASAVES